jgi:hypothetical protein
VSLTVSLPNSCHKHIHQALSHETYRKADMVRRVLSIQSHVVSGYVGAHAIITVMGMVLIDPYFQATRVNIPSCQRVGTAD